MNLEPVIQSEVSQEEKSKYRMRCAKSLQSCLTLCDPMNWRPPGLSVHGILQATVLKRSAMASSRGSSQLRRQTHISYISCTGRQVLYHQRHLGSPNIIYECIYTESRKTVLMNLFAGQEWRCGHRERTCGHNRGRPGDKTGEQH